MLGLAVYAAVWYALQPSYLYIDGETLSSLEVEPTGGTAVLTISTDADDYYVYTPSWVTAEKGFGVLTLSYDSNESGISRTGTVRLSAGDLESQVVLTQEPNTEPVATIEKIWCVHDVSVWTKGNGNPRKVSRETNARKNRTLCRLFLPV